MRIVPIRKGSRGIEGTYANAEHHARDVLPLIRILHTAVVNYGTLRMIEIWEQGHNVHIITRDDGLRLYFRPHRRKHVDGVSGIEVGIKHSRSVEIPLVIIEIAEQAYAFAAFLGSMLSHHKNYYGVSENNNNNEEEE